MIQHHGIRNYGGRRRASKLSLSPIFYAALCPVRPVHPLILEGVSRLCHLRPSNHVLGSTMPCQNRSYQPTPRTSSHQNKPLVIRCNYVRARRLTGCAQTVSSFLLPVPLRTTSIAPSPPSLVNPSTSTQRTTPPLSYSPLIILLRRVVPGTRWLWLSALATVQVGSGNLE